MTAKRLLGIFERLGRGVAVIAMLVLATASVAVTGISQSGALTTDAATTVTYQNR